MSPGKISSLSKATIFLLVMFFALGVASKVKAPVYSDHLSPAAQLRVDFSQGANKFFITGNVVWIWEILQQNNAIYYEGMSSLQRVILFDIPQTANDGHRLILSHQASDMGTNHAYDFITSWPQALKAGTEIAGAPLFVSLNECAPRIGSPIIFEDICVFLHGSGFVLTPDVPDTMGFLLGDDVADKVAAYESYFGNRAVKIYGDAPIVAASMSFDGYSANGAIDANYTLTWTSSSSSILIEMGGHLAVGVDPLQVGIGYGEGRGSANASAKPYSFKLLSLDGFSLGSQDNQIVGAHLLLPSPVCHTTPESETACVGQSVILTGHGAGGKRPYRWEWTKPPDTAILSTDSTLKLSNIAICRARNSARPRRAG